MAEAHYFPYEYSVIPETFAEKTSFPNLITLAPLWKIKWMRFLLLPSIYKTGKSALFILTTIYGWTNYTIIISWDCQRAEKAGQLSDMAYKAEVAPSWSDSTDRGAYVLCSGKKEYYQTSWEQPAKNLTYCWSQAWAGRSVWKVSPGREAGWWFSILSIPLPVVLWKSLLYVFYKVL